MARTDRQPHPLGTELSEGQDSAGRPRRWIAVILGILGICAVLPALLKPAEFMQDDSYFYLQIAHNIAAGLGSTFHGITLTNGYHPLWLWMVTALGTLADGDKTLLLYLVFLLQGLLVAGSIVALRRLTSLMGLRYWLIALAVLTAYLLGTAIYGSEAHVNALSLLVSLGCLSVALRSDRTGIWFLTGMLFGVSLLARLDNIFVVLALSAFSVFDGARDSRRLVVLRTLMLGLGGAVAVLPYLIVNFMDYGHLVPISGAIKSTFPVVTADLNNLGTMGKLSTPFGFVGVIVGIFLDQDRRRRVIWLGLGTGVLLHATYIICFTDHYTFWAWYYVSAVIVAALTTSYLFEWLGARFKDRVSSRAASSLAFAVAALVLAGGSARAWLKAYGLEEIGPFQVDLKINKYRWPDEFAGWMKSNLPADSRIFAYDWPGAIAYHSDLSVLPMDGLMNDFQYNDDLVRLGIHDYLCDHDVHYFFGLIEPWQHDVEVVVTAPLYRSPVGTLYLEEEDIIVRTDDVLSRPDEALPFAIWELRCLATTGNSES